MTGDLTFVKDDGRRLPVSERFLLPILSPTSPGTNYWDPPPPAPLNERQRGRILLQIHQVIDILASVGVSLAGRTFCDIGTGNGLVPRALLEFTSLADAVGVDPYLDGEHKTSWQPHDNDAALADIRDFVLRTCGSRIDYDRYAATTGYENATYRPRSFDAVRSGSKRYRFAKVGAHELGELAERFDLFYCKAIEHIPDWEGVFASISAAAKPGAVVYFKHRPFFSYLGPHRYASTCIPWGHALLTDDEFRRYAREFHAERSAAMCDFYFTGLAYPRYSVADMLRIAAAAGFIPLLTTAEPPRYIAKAARFIAEVPDFWAIQHATFPNAGADELLSGMYHIILRRTG